MKTKISLLNLILGLFLLFVSNPFAFALKDKEAIVTECTYHDQCYDTYTYYLEQGNSTQTCYCSCGTSYEDCGKWEWGICKYIYRLDPDCDNLIYIMDGPSYQCITSGPLDVLP